MRAPARSTSALDRVLAALARRVLRRPGVRTLLALEVGATRLEAGELYVPAAGGGWRFAATTRAETEPPLWRPSAFWRRPSDPAPSRWAQVPSPPAASPWRNESR